MPSERPVGATIHPPLAARLIRGTTRLAWLVVIAATVAAPASVFGATPPGTTGGPTTEPEVSLLSRLLGVAAPLAAIAVALSVVIGLAFVVARIAGPTVGPAAAPSSAESNVSRSAIGRPASVLVAVGACVVGVLAGRAIAYEGSVGGLAGVLGAGILSFFLIVAVVGLALVGLIATKIRHGHVSRPIGTLLAAAGLLATGALGGHATAAAFGGLYHEPVVLEATGATRFDMQAVAVPFVARDGGRAVCRSVPDGRTVADVTALELGELGSGTLRATLSLPAQASDGAAAEFWIDGGDLSDGSIQPFWRGSVQVTEIGADGASGKLIFASLERENGAEKPISESPAPTSAAPGWPSTISGLLSWSCQPW